MVSISTLFDPILLDLLSIPSSIILGVLLILLLNRIWIGVIGSLFFYGIFDFWFWRYFYEEGIYGDNILNTDDIFFALFISVATVILGYLSIKIKYRMTKK